MLKAYYKYKGIAYTASNKTPKSLYSSGWGPEYVLLEEDEAQDQEILLYPEITESILQEFWDDNFYRKVVFGKNLFSGRKWYGIDQTRVSKQYFDEFPDNIPTLCVRVHYVEFQPTLCELAKMFSAKDAKRYLDAHSLQFDVNLLKTL